MENEDAIRRLSAVLDGLRAHNHAAEQEAARMLAANDLLNATKGMLREWDQLTRYGSPMAKAANERVAFARAAVAKAEQVQP